MAEQLLLQRDVEATLIPEGDTVTLKEGLDVVIHQTLGGHYTVQAGDGRKYRIDGHNADALGKEPTAAPEPEQHDAEPLHPEEAEKAAWEKMKTVHDPEIPVNVVDLGLIYTLKMHQRGDGLLLAEVRMSLTAPGCGMGDVLLRDVERQLRTIPGVDTVDAKITFDPVWNPNMMSTAAKLKLGLL